MSNASRPSRRRLRAVTALAAGLAIVLLGLTGAAGAAVLDLSANPDLYQAIRVHPISVNKVHGVLANDSGGDLQLVSHTDPAHGAVTLSSDGSLVYTAQPGFAGDDTFTYTIADAVHLYSTNLPPLATFGGVPLSAGAYGSSLYPDPHAANIFWGLTDRGPNVTAPNGHPVEPIPTFDPAIGKFRLTANKAVLLQTVPLQDALGNPYSGLVNSVNPTGEVIEDLAGNIQPTDPNGYDSEGLVVMKDGTFWVSDEYGPFITHFDRLGRQIERLSPFDGSLPAELGKRVINRGMEGLTITPDGRTLVGTMQSALQQDDLLGSNAKNIVPIRIVTYGLKTHALHEYLYLLDNPKTNATAVSEITALSDTKFLMDERDGNYPGLNVYKKLWEIDITGATDVGPASTAPGAIYDPAHGGLLVGGKTIEATTVGLASAAAAATLAADGITPVSKTLFLDVDSLLLSLDPAARFFSHDKLEGVAALQGGHQIVISNDSDFGISAIANPFAPWQLVPKISPATGKQDDGEYLSVDMDRLVPGTSTAATSTATVTIHVRP